MGISLGHQYSKDRGLYSHVTQWITPSKQDQRVRTQYLVLIMHIEYWNRLVTRALYAILNT